MKKQETSIKENQLNQKVESISKFQSDSEDLEKEFN